MPLDRTWTPTEPTPAPTSEVGADYFTGRSGSVDGGGAPDGFNLQQSRTAPSLTVGTEPPTASTTSTLSGSTLQPPPNFKDGALGGSYNDPYTGRGFDPIPYAEAPPYYVPQATAPAPTNVSHLPGPPVPTTPTPTPTTTPTTGLTALSGLAQTGLQTNPSYTATPGSGFINQGLNPNYYATQQGAQQIAQMLGGQLFTQNYSIGGSAPDQYFVRLPNGQEVNVGNLFAVLNNQVNQENQGVMQQEVLNLLNGANHALPTKGSYVWKDGQLVYDANTAWGGAPGMVADPAQFVKWLSLNPGNNNGGIIPQMTPGQIASGWTQQKFVDSAMAAHQAAKTNPTQPQTPQTPQTPQQPAPQQQQQPNPLAQLAQFFSLFQGAQGGGGNSLQGLLPLLMALMGGQQTQTGPLYSRSQYPRFP